MKIIIKTTHKSVPVSTLFKRLTYQQCEPVGFPSLPEETDLLVSYDCLIIWSTLKIMMKTSLKNINKYEMHVNLGISVSLMCTSPLNVCPFISQFSTPSASCSYHFSDVQLTVLKRDNIPCRCLLNANFTISETSLSWEGPR